MLKVTKLEIEEVLLLEYEVSQDNRATFHRTFSKEQELIAGIDVSFIEEISYHPMKKGTLYGIHFQNHPKAQSKLIYCTKGRILDFAVDLRQNSTTYKQWVCIELSAVNKKQLLIPAGFGHAALTLEDDTNIIMRIDNYFDPHLSRAIRYDDPDLALSFDAECPTLSEQDRLAPFLVDCDFNL